ncbi:MAG: pilus assembly protein PilM, partial [Planctomycetota bacterium]
MALFGKSKSFLGIDLGTSSIKLVELKEEGGQPRLLTYGFVEEPTDIVKSDSVEAQGKTIALLKQLIKKTGVVSQGVVAAMPSFTVFSSIISLPSMSNKDLNSAIRWEAKKFVPMPLEEMVLDWRLLREKEAD